MSRQATAWTRRVVNRFYQFELNARTPQESGHWHFCREILRRALDGWRDHWVAAHYYTYGLHPVKYRISLARRLANYEHLPAAPLPLVLPPETQPYPARLAKQARAKIPVRSTVNRPDHPTREDYAA